MNENNELDEIIESYCQWLWIRIVSAIPVRLPCHQRFLHL